MVLCEAQRAIVAPGVPPVASATDTRKQEGKACLLDVTVKPCALGLQCKAKSHHHMILSNGGKKPLDGAARRIAEKAVLCKSQLKLVLCDLDMDCPSREIHFHPRFAEKKPLVPPPVPITPQDQIEEATANKEAATLVKKLEKEINDPATRQEVMEDLYVKVQPEPKMKILILPAISRGIPESAAESELAKQERCVNEGRAPEVEHKADEPAVPLVACGAGGDGGHESDSDDDSKSDSERSDDSQASTVIINARDDREEERPILPMDVVNAIVNELLDHLDVGGEVYNPMLQHGLVDPPELIVARDNNVGEEKEPEVQPENNAVVEAAEEKVDSNNWLKVIPDKGPEKPEEPFRYPDLDGDYELKVTLWEKENSGAERVFVSSFFAWLKDTFADTYRGWFYFKEELVPANKTETPDVFSRIGSVQTRNAYYPKFITRVLFGKPFSRDKSKHYDTLDEGVYRYSREVVIWNDLYIRLSETFGSTMAGNFQGEVFTWNAARVLDEVKKINKKYFHPVYQERTVFTMGKILNDITHRQCLSNKVTARVSIGDTTYRVYHGDHAGALGANFRS